MYHGELAQMVERPLRMREVPGSIPGFSNSSLFFCVTQRYLLLVIYYRNIVFLIFYFFWGFLCFPFSDFSKKRRVEVQVYCSTVFAKTIPSLLSFQLKQMSKDLITLLNYLKVVIVVFQSVHYFFSVKRDQHVTADDDLLDTVI